MWVILCQLLDNYYLSYCSAVVILGILGYKREPMIDFMALNF